MFIFLVRNARHAIQIKGVQFAGKIYSEKRKEVWEMIFWSQDFHLDTI
jgi:hypothetical protein